MTYVLNSRERKALNRLHEQYPDILIGAKMGGAGPATMSSLVELGLAEVARNERHSKDGWRITDDGWRCLYGKTHGELMATGPHFPLKVWSWPPSDR